MIVPHNHNHPVKERMQAKIIFLFRRCSGIELTSYNKNPQTRSYREHNEQPIASYMKYKRIYPLGEHFKGKYIFLQQSETKKFLKKYFYAIKF